MQKTIAIVCCLLLSALLAGCGVAPPTHADRAPAGPLAPAAGHKTLPNYILNGDASS